MADLTSLMVKCLSFRTYNHRLHLCVFLRTVIRVAVGRETRLSVGWVDFPVLVLQSRVKNRALTGVYRVSLISSSSHRVEVVKSYLCACSSFASWLNP